MNTIDLFLWKTRSTDLRDTYYSIAFPFGSDFVGYNLHVKNPGEVDCYVYTVHSDNIRGIIDIPNLHLMSEEEIFQESLVADYGLPFDLVLQCIKTIIREFKDFSSTGQSRMMIQVQY